jgi:hypothetical protein
VSQHITALRSPSHHCSICRRTDRWRRLTAAEGTPGGWVCCRPRVEPENRHALLGSHRCTTACDPRGAERRR